MKTYETNETYIEIQEQDVPNENPNPKNDIYKSQNVEGSDGFFMFHIFLGEIIFVVGIVFAIKIAEKAGWAAVKELWLWGLMPLSGGWMVASQLRAIYYKYSFRKRVLKNGIGYPGVIVNYSGYWKSQPIIGGYDEYKLTIRYKDKTFTNIVQEHPEKYLENPYCTVYEFGKKTIAADFKVKEQYITEKGTLKG